MTTINQVHTSCKNCVFAVYDGNTQTDCHLRLIDKYKEKNAEIIEVYDDDKEFYVINNKRCVGYRLNDWFKQFDLENASIEDKVNKFHETNKLNYLCVIDLKNLSENDFEDICKQFNILSIKPKKIIYLRRVDNELNFSYEKMKSIIDQYSPGCVWRIQTILDNNLSDEHILYSSISMNPKLRFVLYINNATKDIEHIINNTNKIVYEDLGSFKIISNKTKDCMIFSNMVYRFAAKTTNINLLSQSQLYQII